MQRAIVWCLLFLLVHCCFFEWTAGQTENYPRHLSFKTSGGTINGGEYFVFWKNNTENVTFEVHAPTLGWVGLGFSPNGGMTGADIIMGGVKDGKPYIGDYHGVGNTQPILDDHQHTELLQGIENDTHTVIKFKRKMNTCYKYDWVLNDDTIRIIWAIGEKDIITPTSFEKHVDRGTRSVMLLEPSKRERFKMTDDVKILDMNVTKIAIPSNYSTAYFCKIIKLPKMNKHHIIRYEAVFDGNNEKYVHHIIAFHCVYNMEKYVNQQELCFSTDQSSGSAMYKCMSRYKFGWAVGAEGVVYPENLGYPIENDENNSPYYLLQMHYENPNGDKGIVDSSGLRFYMTEKLRPTEIGSLLVGAAFDNSSIMLPPGQKSLQLKMACDNCMKGLPSEGINVIGAWLHMHYVGRKMWVRHIRKGTELAPIMQDMWYDFNYQEPRFLTTPVHVKPTDAIMVECEYNTMDQEKLIFGGYESRQEMCIAFIDYYPKTDDLYTCAGGPTQTTFGLALGATIVSKNPLLVKGPFSAKSVEVPDYAAAVQWDKGLKNGQLRTEKGEYFDHILNTGAQYEYCSQRDFSNSSVPDLPFGDLLSKLNGKFSPGDPVPFYEKIKERMYNLPQGLVDMPKVPYKTVDQCKLQPQQIQQTQKVNNSESSNVAASMADPKNKVADGSGPDNSASTKSIALLSMSILFLSCLLINANFRPL